MVISKLKKKKRSDGVQRDTNDKQTKALRTLSKLNYWVKNLLYQSFYLINLLNFQIFKWFLYLSKNIDEYKKENKIPFLDL